MPIKDVGEWSRKPGHVVWIGLHEPGLDLLRQLQAEFGLYVIRRRTQALGTYPVRPFQKASAMACEDIVAQCFMDEQAPLAVPELNRERTIQYLEWCDRHGLCWDDAKQQTQEFLHQRGGPH